jgi:hypothetical protein
VLATALAASLATAAAAEIVIRSPGETLVGPVAADQIRITLNLNTFVPGPNDNSDQSQKAQESGRRTVYELAEHECAILRDTIASGCRLESINVNMQRVAPAQNFGQAHPDGFNINATVNLHITPK